MKVDIQKKKLGQKTNIKSKKVKLNIILKRGIKIDNENILANSAKTKSIKRNKVT